MSESESVPVPDKGGWVDGEEGQTREGETLPVPEKGGWIDGEGGPGFGGPPPVEGIPVRREDSGEQPAPKRDEPKAPSVPRKDKDR